MKLVVAIGIVIFQLLLGCKNAAVAVQEDSPVGYQDVVKDEEEKPKQEQSFSLEKLIGNKSYNILTHSDSIKIANIQSVLIEGTQNEFGRKIEIIKEFKTEDGKLLNSIVNNENYIEVRDDNFPFNPTLQFQLEYEGELVLLLLDEKNGTLSFTSVQGQTIFKIAEPLKEELIILSNN